MHFLKDTGFVIKRINLGESDRYVTLFTREHGKIEVLAKGVRRITSRRAPHIELLNLIRFQTTKTKKNHILTEVEIVDNFDEIRHEMHQIGKVFLICELVNALCPDEQRHPEVFNLMHNTLNDLRGEHYEDTMFDFQVNVLSTLGFWDRRDKFRSSEELTSFIETIIEKKMQTNFFFNV